MKRILNQQQCTDNSMYYYYLELLHLYESFLDSQFDTLKYKQMNNILTGEKDIYFTFKPCINIDGIEIVANNLMYKEFHSLNV